MAAKCLWLCVLPGCFISMIICSWNVRGLGRGEKRRMVRDMISSHKPQIVFIQESKLQVFDRKVVSSLGGSSLTRGIGVEADGAAGGLLTLWNEDSFLVEDCISNSRCIIVAGVLTKIKKTCSVM
ncbi:hypothetical protein Dsin_023339 [Dipteronia sinensis]|uniref:Endonuclease/exonuclease/phosphatase domain-containing protein n=1 Tax=Dipteronia sinensis TaxID=43782 RepID=A0AAE0A3D5_9ROSI|nr:hypothetical protein Dsin_023339 [Dipteronia sinensis]